MRKILVMIFAMVCSIPFIFTGGCGQKEEAEDMKNITGTIPSLIDGAFHERTETATFALG